MRFLGFIIIFSLFGCHSPEAFDLENVLRSEHPKIKKVIESAEMYEVQILISQIEKDQNGKTSFVDHQFMVNNDNYFYPASSVKFPIALLALEKIHEEALYNANTLFFIEGDTSRTSVNKEVQKIFAVSDNDAYNRLFEFIGQDQINQRLHQKGLIPSRISHRLATKDTDKLTTKTLIFETNDSLLTHSDPIRNKEITALQLNKLQKGKGYYDDGILIKDPFDFSFKNYLPISTLHNCMKRIIFPENFSKEELFNISNEDRVKLLQTMKSVPRKMGYDEQKYYDSYVKFFMFGDNKKRIPETIEIYNKVGYAYGYVTDCAYIKDNANDVEFIITASIHVNKNNIFNDDQYEYETIGIPFLAQLGREVHLQLTDKK